MDLNVAFGVAHHIARRNSLRRQNACDFCPSILNTNVLAVNVAKRGEAITEFGNASRLHSRVHP